MPGGLVVLTCSVCEVACSDASTSVPPGKVDLATAENAGEDVEFYTVGFRCVVYVEVSQPEENGE